MSYEHEDTEWRAAVVDMSEMERGRYEDLATDADMWTPDGARR